MNDMTNGVFEDTDYGKIAINKLSPVTPNFRIYKVGLVGDDKSTFEVIGAEFRTAKSGKNKGKLCIIMTGTKRTTYVTSDEINRL